jgi:transcription elongation factor GreB
LESLTVVTPSPAQQGRVFFGAYVDVEDEDGHSSRYRLVGPDELDLARGWVSIDSPVAKALLGKSEGDTVQVQRPRGPVELTIVKTTYDKS